MQHLDAADYLVIGAFAIAFFGLLAWVVLYAVSTRGDWRLTREGRHLMAFRASLVVFMGMGVANNIWPVYPGRDAVRISIVTLFACSVLDGLRVLRIAQTGRRERAADRLPHLPVGEEDRAGEHQTRTDVLGS